MQSAKSLRKLRSATTAYLEDGGALIHSIDTLILDVQHAIEELSVREQAIIDREQRLQERETTLRAFESRILGSLDQLLLQGPGGPAENFPVEFPFTAEQSIAESSIGESRQQEEVKSGSVPHLSDGFQSFIKTPSPLAVLTKSRAPKKRRRPLR